MSMFGGVGHFIGQVFAGGAGGGGATGGGGPAIPPGGFPGIFPGGGVSNSGWAGLNQLQNQPPCTPDDVRRGRCTMGPPPGLSGAKRPGWR